MTTVRGARVPDGRLLAVDVLRGLAAAWIVLYYAVVRTEGRGTLSGRYAALGGAFGDFHLWRLPVEVGRLLAHAGDQGVPLFLLLTAFSMTYRAARADSAPVFRWRRLARVLVPYWSAFALVLVTVATLAWVRHAADGAAFTRELADNTFRGDSLYHVDPAAVVAGLTLVPRGLSAEWYGAPPFALALVLPLLQFLLLFPLLFAALKKLGPWTFLAGALAVTVWAIVPLALIHEGSGLKVDWWVDSAWLPFNLLTFALGMALAWLVVTERPALARSTDRWFRIATIVGAGLLAYVAGSLAQGRSSILSVPAGPLIVFGLAVMLIPWLARTQQVPARGIVAAIASVGSLSICLLAASDPLFFVYGTLRQRAAPAWGMAIFWMVFAPLLLLLAWCVSRLTRLFVSDTTVRRLRQPRLAAAAALLVVAVAGGAAFVVRAEPFAGQTGLPFLVERPAAAYSSAQICQLLGSDKGGARIRGQDGGTTNVVNGKMYWTFGDTVLDDNLAVPNNVAYSTDFEADDCITLTHKRDARGFAAPLLPTEPGEMTVWPAAGQISTDDHTVYFLYNSMASVDIATGTFHARGIGLGKFDTADLNGKRVIDLLIDAGDIRSPVSPSPTVSAVDMLSDGGYLYVYFSVGTNARVGRVPLAQIEDRSAYRYWNGRDWVPRVNDSVDILRTRGGEQGFNVDYSPFVGKWTAVYATNTLTATAIAYADAPQGPFVDETVLFDCRQLVRDKTIARPLLSPQYADRYFCYHATQHPELDKDGRQTIYLTYANLSAYTLYLHKVVLALPFFQWDGPDGKTVYARANDAPAGYRRRGVAFYAPTQPDGSLAPIYDWYDPSSNEHRYGASSPGGRFEQRQIAFYASTSPMDGLVPVYVWTREDETTVYSTFDLSGEGYRRGEAAFYTRTLDDQPSLDTKLGFVYYVHVKGDSDVGCCDVTNNPTAQTEHRSQEFHLRTRADPKGYEGVVCSPVCGTGGRIVWKGDVYFSSITRRLTLTPNGQAGR